MLTRFEKIPDDFVGRYDPELRIWACEFRRWGRFLKIPLRGRVAGVPERDEHGGEPLIVVELEADLCGGVMTVKPADAVSADLIERHIAALRGRAH